MAVAPTKAVAAKTVDAIKHNLMDFVKCEKMGELFKKTPIYTRRSRGPADVLMRKLLYNRFLR